MHHGEWPTFSVLMDKYFTLCKTNPDQMPKDKLKRKAASYRQAIDTNMTKMTASAAIPSNKTGFELLIERMLHPNPLERITMQEASTTFNQLYSLS
jgi:hypothetical protein